MEIIERFWQKVHVCAHGYTCAACCWLWTASHGREGYGRITLHAASSSATGMMRNINAHRLSWMLNCGDIPQGLWVLHNCPGGDNRLCVNPAHLWLGTNKENIQDALHKGTLAFGDRNGVRRHPEAVVRGAKQGNAVLTDEYVLDIRYLAAHGMPHRLLGYIYGVNRTSIGRIVRGQNWTHLPMIVEER
jgi:HNH endonuclease